jgi:hypothetical protein
LENELATTRVELGRVQTERDNLISCDEINNNYNDERVNKIERELLKEKNFHAISRANNRIHRSLQHHLEAKLENMQGKLDKELLANERYKCSICKESFGDIISKGKIQFFFVILFFKYLNIKITSTSLVLKITSQI